MRFRVAATFWYNTKGENCIAGITRFAEFHTEYSILEALNNIQDKIFEMKDAIDVDLIKFIITVEYDIGTWDLRHSKEVEYI